MTIVEGQKNIPFDVKRIYYLYDIPGGETRGGHAHKELYQLIIAAGGSFNVLLDDGLNKKIVTLNRPDYGLLVVPGIWRELFEFSSGAIGLVLVSNVYEESALSFLVLEKISGDENSYFGVVPFLDYYRDDILNIQNLAGFGWIRLGISGYIDYKDDTLVWVPPWVASHL